MNKCPIGAIDGSRGIHPTGEIDTPRSSVAYATVGYVGPMIGEQIPRLPSHRSYGTKGNIQYIHVIALPLKPEAGARPVQRHLEDIKKVIRAFISKI